MPFLFFIYPFLWNGGKAKLRAKNTPLLFKKLNVINYKFMHTFAIERWNDKSSHEITIIKENNN
jgi:hypothetical protein